MGLSNLGNQPIRHGCWPRIKTNKKGSNEHTFQLGRCRSSWPLNHAESLQWILAKISARSTWKTVRTYSRKKAKEEVQFRKSEKNTETLHCLTFDCFSSSIQSNLSKDSQFRFRMTEVPMPQKTWMTLVSRKKNYWRSNHKKFTFFATFEHLLFERGIYLSCSKWNRIEFKNNQTSNREKLHLCVIKLKNFFNICFLEHQLRTTCDTKQGKPLIRQKRKMSIISIKMNQSSFETKTWHDNRMWNHYGKTFYRAITKSKIL